MKIEDLVIGKQYDFGSDGAVTLMKIDKTGFYVKGDKMKSYATEYNGSVGFNFISLNDLTEIKK